MILSTAGVGGYCAGHLEMLICPVVDCLRGQVSDPQPANFANSR